MPDCASLITNSLRLGLLLSVLLVLGDAHGAAAEEDRVQAIERTMRARPEAALKALTPVIADAHGAELVAALVLQGKFLNVLADDAGIEQTGVQLDQIAERDPHGSATSAALLVRSLPLIRHGPIGRADRMLSQAFERLPPDARDDLRWAMLEQRVAAKRELGKVEEAIAFSQQEINLSDRLGVAWQRATSRVDMTYALWRAQQPEQALAVCQTAIEIAHAGNDPVSESVAWLGRAQVTSELGRNEDEFRATRMAIQLARQAGDERQTALGLANMSDHYLRIADYNTALSVAREALPLTRAVHDLGTETVALGNAGLALIRLGNHDQGMALMRDATAIAERRGAISMMADIQHEMGEALEHAGRLDEAWRALREYRHLYDENFRREQQQAVLELEESFDAERRQNALTLLKTENGLQEAYLLSRNLQMRVWAVAATAGLLILVLVGLLVSRMRRSNAQLSSTNERLKLASESDPLTGLSNRRHFRASMQERGSRFGHFRGAMILIDLDHFKQINDGYGHAVGDAVLVTVAQRLQAAMRDGDMAVRWGGEEFLVALREMPLDQVEQLADRLLHVIADTPVRTGNLSLTVTASLGFASFPLQPDNTPVSWERAIDLVDQVMYLAKSQGRNRACGLRQLSAATAVLAEGDPATLADAWRGGGADVAQLIGPAQGGPAQEGIVR